VLPEANCGKSLMPMLRRVGEPAHANGGKVISNGTAP
jgi:hypothetical protein